MKNELYKKIYPLIYKKSILENIILDLEMLKSKFEGLHKIEKGKAAEILEKIKTKEIRDICIDELEHDRMGMFSEKNLTTILALVQDITNEAKIVYITIAIPLIETDIHEIAKQLEVKLDTKVILDIRIDPGLIGGIVIKEDKYIFDASLRSHLKTYEAEWVKSVKRHHKAFIKSSEQAEQES